MERLVAAPLQCDQMPKLCVKHVVEKSAEFSEKETKEGTFWVKIFKGSYVLRRGLKKHCIFVVMAHRNRLHWHITL